MKVLSLGIIFILLGIFLVLPATAEDIIECGFVSGGGISAQTISVEFNLASGDSLSASVSGTQARITILKLPQKIVASTNGYQNSPTIGYQATSNNGRYRLLIEMASSSTGEAYSYSYSFCISV